MDMKESGHIIGTQQRNESYIVLNIGLIPGCEAKASEQTINSEQLVRVR